MSDSDAGESPRPSEDEQETVQGEVVPLDAVREIVREETQQLVEIQASFHAGPLPDHESFASYERTLPGAADRIVTMTEKEQSERHRLQRVNLYANIAIRVLGMLFAVGVAVLAILIGADLIRDGEDIEGLAVLLAGLGPIIAAFLFRRNLPTLPRPQQGNGGNGGNGEA